MWVGHFSPQPTLAVSQPHFFKAAAQGLVHLLQFPFQQHSCEEARSLLLWPWEKGSEDPGCCSVLQRLGSRQSAASVLELPVWLHQDPA